MEQFKLKGGMQLGVSSSATQIEGGDKRNSWYDWYKKGYIKDASSPLRANDNYNLYMQDTDLMSKMGIKYYRLGIEWSRIEPAKGVFNNGEIKHYREELEYLIASGIKPLITLHHFTNPMWFEELGGFESSECVDIFLRYVKKMVESFGDIVNEYITINEPNVFAVNGYFFGAWPPGKQSLKCVSKVYTNMSICHIKAYELIHQVREKMGYNDTMVSVALHMRVFEPKDPTSRYQSFSAKKLDQYFQTSLARAMLRGEVKKPLKKLGLPQGKYCDFIALNYYTRSTVTGFADGVKEGSAVNDLGWEIYPQGIVECAQKLYDILPLPIYVTENGTCDNADTFRVKYIYEHLKMLSETSLPVERYYHWSFTDNFEWLEGESARFGLVYVDYDNQQRTVKTSGEFYSDIIRSGGVTDAMCLKYAGQFYRNAQGETLSGIDEKYFDYTKALASEDGESVVMKVSQFVQDPNAYIASGQTLKEPETKEEKVVEAPAQIEPSIEKKEPEVAKGINYVLPNLKEIIAQNEAKAEAAASEAAHFADTQTKEPVEIGKVTSEEES